MEIQWFPGHMSKTRRMMEEDMRLVDLVVEVVDARIPLSSKNPYLDTLWKRRPRIIALNKTDLADPEASSLWREYYRAQGFGTVLINGVKGQGIADIVPEAERLLQDKRERDRKKGMAVRPIRMMVTGIPNVGKSTVINRLVGRAGAAKTGNKPGVTRGRQWVKIRGGAELLDTPGILWPKFEDPEVGMKLAWIGSIKDELLDMDELAYQLLLHLSREKRRGLQARFGLTEEELALDPVPLIERIGCLRGFKLSGGHTDFSRTARMLVDEFREGKLGRITLEYPEKKESEDQGGTKDDRGV